MIYVIAPEAESKVASISVVVAPLKSTFTGPVAPVAVKVSVAPER